jgi:hypothetical protein
MFFLQSVGELPGVFSIGYLVTLHYMFYREEFEVMMKHVAHAKVNTSAVQD